MTRRSARPAPPASKPAGPTPTPLRIRPIAANWEVYEHVMLERGAKPGQLTEIRRAFYTGADMILRTIFANLSAGPGCEASDETLMEDVEADIKTFAAEISEGRA